MHRRYPGEFRTRVIDFVEGGGSRGYKVAGVRPVSTDNGVVIFRDTCTNEWGMNSAQPPPIRRSNPYPVRLRKHTVIILKRRIHSALFLARHAGLLEIELSLDAPARLVSNFAVSKQLINVVAFGSN
jgi:hypothetical protein